MELVEIDLTEDVDALSDTNDDNISHKPVISSSNDQHRQLQGRAFTGNARPDVLSSAILSPQY